MIIFVLIVVFTMLAGIRSAGKNEFYFDYCSREQTTCINGIFVMLIFIGHTTQFFKPTGPLGDPYNTFKTYMGQLVVVSFLFYSGYGITESIKKRGIDYVKSIPIKRFFRIWYHLALVVTVYVVYSLVAKMNYPISRYLLAYTGWTSLCGSNWYICATLVLYIAIFISFMIFRKSIHAATLLTAVLTFLSILFEIKMGQPKYYYNTVMCFPVGMLFSLIKPYFDRLFLKHDIIWLLGFGSSCGIFYYLGTLNKKSLIFYILWAISATFVLVFITMKVKIQNSILKWFGQHVFSIYVFQWLPLCVFRDIGLSKSHPYAFVIISFVSTVLISVLFDALTEKTDALIYSRNKKAKSPIMETNKLQEK